MNTQNIDIVDYYESLQIDRTADTNAIRKLINDRMKLWMKNEASSQPGSDGLKHSQFMLKLIDAANAVLCDDTRRQAYNIELDRAYQTGVLSSEKQAEAIDAIKLAEEYFNKGKPELAAQHAMQAIENNPSNSKAYEILTHSQYLLGDYNDALGTDQKAIELFAENTEFEWLYSRLSINLDLFEQAQGIINKVLSRDKSNPLFNAEQVYLYCRADRTELAFSEVNSFISEHSDNNLYKEYVASNLLRYARTLYFVDQEKVQYVMTEHKSFEECLRVCEFANSLYPSDETRQELDDINSFGEKQFDQRHIPKLIFMGVVLILIVYFKGLQHLIGFAAFAIIAIEAAALFKISFRPVWAVNREAYVGELREEYTGKRSPVASLILSISDMICFPLGVILGR